MVKSGLVLEGGGMRGVYTAGVLSFLMEQELYFPYVIGVSAGACNGSSYIARQKERNKTVNIDFIKHPEYISVKRWFKQRELFGMDFLFDKLPNHLAPFDFNTFHNAEERFVVVATDCDTGKPVYFEKTEHKDHILTLIRASSSLPYMAPIIDYDGKKLLDGGVADPIPIKKAISDGYERNVIILTRNKGHRKNESKLKWMLSKTYRNYPNLVNAIFNRYRIYNETMDYIEQLEKEGKVYIIRPETNLNVSRIERNPSKLENLYKLGYKEAEEQYEEFKRWLI